LIDTPESLLTAHEQLAFYRSILAADPFAAKGEISRIETDNL